VTERTARGRWVGAVAVAMTLTVGAGCVDADRSVSLRSPASSTTTTTTPVPIPPGPTTTTVGEREVAPAEWQDCGEGFQCAELAVPVDHAQPGGPTLTLALVRQPAQDPARRIGSLLMNPGGPGGSAVGFVRNVAGSLPAPLQERFDIVGFDPRGVGGSTPVACEAGVAAMYEADPTIEDAADRDLLLQTSQAFVDDCEQRHGDLLPYLGTEDVARDMDLVRQAVGDDELTYVGLSYGTAIGQVYADLFPDRIRAMVLDGVVDLSRPGVDGARLQASGFERALDAFAADCQARPACPLADDPEGAIEQVMGAVEAQPLPANSEPDGVGPGLAALGIAQAMYSTALWAPLAQSVEAALDGDGTTLALLGRSYLSGPSFSAYFAVNCLDSEWPEADALLAAGKDVAGESPHFGEALVNDYVRCSLWPAEPNPIGPPQAEGSPPIVVLSTTDDPATPYESGVAVADLLPQGVLVTNEGAGHTIFTDGKSCIDDATVPYLVDLTVPADELRC